MGTTRFAESSLVPSHLPPKYPDTKIPWLRGGLTGLPVWLIVTSPDGHEERFQRLTPFTDSISLTRLAVAGTGLWFGGRKLNQVYGSRFQSTPAMRNVFNALRRFRIR